MTLTAEIDERRKRKNNCLENAFSKLSRQDNYLARMAERGLSGEETDIVLDRWSVNPTILRGLFSLTPDIKNLTKDDVERTKSYRTLKEKFQQIGIGISVTETKDSGYCSDGHRTPAVIKFSFQSLEA